VTALEGRLQEQARAGGADICVGDIFLDLKPLANTYNSYASSYEEALHILNSSTFGDYMQSVLQDLAPLNLDQHLKAPFDAMTRYEAAKRVDGSHDHHRDARF
jgi:hypothetical protein